MNSNNTSKTEKTVTGKADAVKGPVRSRLRIIITALVFILLIFGTTAANLLYTPPSVSASERRTLAKFTPPTWAGIVNKSFMTAFDDDYSLDSFIGRDFLRSVKAVSKLYVFSQKDSGGLYVNNGSIFKTEELDEKSVYSAGVKFGKVIAEYLRDVNVYYSVIPGKSHYNAEKLGYPAMDYEKLLSLLSAGMQDASYIDITGALDENSYYKTDLHWDQTKLMPVLAALGDAMGFDPTLNGAYEKALGDFYGVYYGQLALPMEKEPMTCFITPAIQNAKVSLLDTKTLELYASVMYAEDKLDGIDPYDVFISGVQPLVVIENPDAGNDRELYLFRDSYGSSIAPLLCEAYSKIYLIDFRYLASPMLSHLIDFKPGNDALFLYGTVILNSSGTLLVQ